MTIVASTSLPPQAGETQPLHPEQRRIFESHDLAGDALCLEEDYIARNSIGDPIYSRRVNLCPDL
jgi:hypothetical protein